MVTMFLSFCLLLLSFLGYVLYIQQKGIHIAFAPVLAVSGIGIFMFLAGLLNFMPMASRLILLIGCVLLYRARPIQKSISPSCKHPALLFFLSLIFLLFFRLFNAMPIHYDNFSHWMLVIRDMLINHRLPTYQSELITFQGYPTGSACFIYYVCRIIGDSEGAMLIGQAMILVSCLTVFWAFVKQITPANCIVILLTTLYLLAANNTITDLLVDSMLACLGIAQFAALIYYQDDLKKAGFCSCLIGAFLTIVKNSGLFFVAVHAFVPLMYALFYKRHDIKVFLLDRKHWHFLFTSLSMPVVLWYLWYRHVKLVFPFGVDTKHSMTPQNYLHTFSSKGSEQIREILSSFVQRVFTFQSEGCLFLLLAVIYILIFVSVYHRKSSHPSCGWFVIWSLLIYFCYQIGLVGMYLVSMPTTEAMNMAGYERYLSTITMYLVGVAVLALLPVLNHTAKWETVLFPAVSLLLVLTVRNLVPHLFYNIENIYEYYETRTRLIQLKSDYDIAAGCRYYLVGPDDAGYLYYLARYEFFSPYVDFRENPEPEEFPDFFDRYDYLILMSDHDLTDPFVSALGLPLGHQVYELSEFQ